MRDSYQTTLDREPDAAPDPACSELGQSGARVDARSLMELIGFERAEGGSFDRVSFATRQVREGQILTHAGDVCRTLYVVRTGSFKTCMLDSSGSIQGLGFPMPGETVGLDGLASGQYGSESTALEASEVIMIPVEHMADLSRNDSSMAMLFYRLIGREIVRDQSVLSLLGSLSAEARVATFLLDLSDRQVALGHARWSLNLPMTRRDIANYLGLKIETVSRALSAFSRDGILRVQKRKVELLDPRQLRDIARDTLGATRARHVPSLRRAAHGYAFAA